MARRYKPGKRITAKQKAARRKNIKIARAHKKVGRSKSKLGTASARKLIKKTTSKRLSKRAARNEHSLNALIQNIITSGMYTKGS